MGAASGDDDADDTDKPQHPVRITKGFWLSRVPVTVAAYKRFVQDTGRRMPEAPGFNPLWSKPDHPIVRVNWEEAKAFCEWSGGRLPTEAEWEYAARGGREGRRYPWGDQIGPEDANYRGSKWKGSSPVGSYPPNDLGLYDMAGNVWEWVADWHDGRYYSTMPLDQPVEDPKGPKHGPRRVLRGGAWADAPRFLRVTYRIDVGPGARYDVIGFRCAGVALGGGPLE